ncbi:TIGR02281 family clan AA aspartic protease [Phenylobacterium sp.]|uniref:retropepsin-like aspartic protease family protein n=1 Tax=Phenylobacterium sp. TaxID=1871053 RepID=UPI00289D1CA8|nr:TIGR02281 family clan AA aspartic protease [Phenylobacterium sp.]
MPFTAEPDWRHLALLAVASAFLLVVLFNIPRIGPFIRAAFSFMVLALGLLVIFQRAPFDPYLSQLAERLGFDNQRVVGREVRIAMSPDGHFWVAAAINGAERRMLVDSGATVTALTPETARLAGVEADLSLVPLRVRTANGIVEARAGTVEKLDIGGIEAMNLKVVISPAPGSIDVLGMNFLSQLSSWRVEGRTLILTPPAPAASGAQDAP